MHKPSNPKDAVGVTRAPLSCVPCPVLFELGGAMLEGALKYGRHNYRAVGVRHTVYYDAIMRHIMAWWEGEDTDPDSGFHHLAKAMACIAVLRDSMLQGNDTDDRPIKSPEGWLNPLHDNTRALLERYPDPKTPHTAQANDDPADSTD